MKEIIIMSSLAGILGTGIGGILGIFFGKKTISKTLSFTGGIMIGIVFFDLFPLALDLSNAYISIVSVLIGVFFTALLDSFINKDESMNMTKEKKFINTGIMLLISMAIHNFFEGMAIGSSSVENLQLGLLVAIAIGLHDVPEGMAIAAPLTAGLMKKNKIISLTIFSGVSTILGAILGYLLGGISIILHSVCLSLAAGAMLYVVYGELLPDAFSLSPKKQSAIMIILGIAVTFILLNFLK